ncbi:prepilin-type N-terminal cleavage/methylation domain-containing protein [Candidatus Poribacteria bacterium]|nr:prepilin-type N-terminal cleavage/methylation domain-containing protein [Candidatus Poribacteria bacterium]
MISILPHKFTNDKGFTLLESVISIMLLSITTLGIYGIIILAQESSLSAKYTTTAANFARMKLEKIMDTEYTKITQSYVQGTIYDANPYDDVSFPASDPDGDYAPSLPSAKWRVEYFYPNAGTDPLVIKLKVFWKEKGANKVEHNIQLSSKLTSGRI